MSAMEYGHEYKAIAKSDVKELGTMFYSLIHPEHFYLGAMSEDIIRDEGHLGINFPAIAENMTLD